jgi:hypothetical protein
MPDMPEKKDPPVALRLMLNLTVTELRSTKGPSLVRIGRLLAVLGQRLAEEPGDFRAGEVLSIDGDLVALWAFDSEEVMGHAPDKAAN